MQKFRKKPVEVEAVQWIGGAENATPIINWILEQGGTANWIEAGIDRANPNCPTSAYHATHNYCPSCPFTSEPERLAVKTLEGTMSAWAGDWIIKGVINEFYPCKPEVFDQTYDRIENPT